MYGTKTIVYNGQPTRILVQNDVGSSALLAIANVMCLRGLLSLKSDRKYVTEDTLVHMLTDVLHEIHPPSSPRQSDESGGDPQQLRLVADTVAYLDQLQRIVTVPPTSEGVDPSPGRLLHAFQAFHIQLRHANLGPERPSGVPTATATGLSGSATGSGSSLLLVPSDSSASALHMHTSNSSDVLLDSTSAAAASEVMPAEVLKRLLSAVPAGSLTVLIFARGFLPAKEKDGGLYLLDTTHTYAHLPAVVWQRLRSGLQSRPEYADAKFHRIDEATLLEMEVNSVSRLFTPPPSSASATSSHVQPVARDMSNPNMRRAQVSSDSRFAGEVERKVKGSGRKRTNRAAAYEEELVFTGAVIDASLGHLTDEERADLELARREQEKELRAAYGDSRRRPPPAVAPVESKTLSRGAAADVSSDSGSGSGSDEDDDANDEREDSLVGRSRASPAAAASRQNNNTGTNGKPPPLSIRVEAVPASAASAGPLLPLPQQPAKTGEAEVEMGEFEDGSQAYARRTQEEEDAALARALAADEQARFDQRHNRQADSARAPHRVAGRTPPSTGDKVTGSYSEDLNTRQKFLIGVVVVCLGVVVFVIVYFSLNR